MNGKLLLFCGFVSGANMAQRNFPWHNPVSPQDKFFSGANKDFFSSRHLFIPSIALLILILLLLFLLPLIPLYKSQGCRGALLAIWVVGLHRYFYLLLIFCCVQWHVCIWKRYFYPLKAEAALLRIIPNSCSHLRP